MAVVARKQRRRVKMRKLLLVALVAVLVAVIVSGCLRSDLGNLHNF